MLPSVEKFIKSFSNAFTGIRILFKTQPNARFELFIAVSVIVAGIIFNISSIEWVTVLILIALVFGFEAINTSIEFFADKIHPHFDQEIGKVKDVAAGAVLIAAFVAAIVGFIIFVPKFINLFTN